MDIPKRFQEAWYTDWKEGTPLNELILDYINNFDDHYRAGKAPFLVGKAGTGKTRAAAAIANAIKHGADENLSVSWYSASEVFNQVLDAKDLYMKDLYVRLKSDLRSSDFIVIDDISTLRSYPRLTELFWSVLDYRYSEMKPTLMTANFDLVDGEDFWVSLEHSLTPAISRRIKECSEGLTLVI